MHDPRLREKARALAQRGRSPGEVACDLGLPRSTVYRWLSEPWPPPATARPRCWVCDAASPPPGAAAAYAYVLGQYLGDGHLVTSARIPVLRIYACTDYPDVLRQVRDAIECVRGTAPGLVRLVGSARVRTVQSYWMHWPCVLPQHGPGPKHRRPIVLTGWQQELAAEHPWALLRGLIHSDGCRSLNTVRVRGRSYCYPRYFFANESSDILAIAGRTLDLVGVAWRLNRPNSISVARREAVQLMDRHIGPKR